MYEFRNLDPIARGEPIFIPSEALLIYGNPLETQLMGYQTLNVSGRELLPLTLTTQDITGARVTKRVTGTAYDSREITVKYMLTADDVFEYRTMYEQLNVLLGQPQFEFSFADEPDYGWVGTMTAADAPEPGSNVVTGSFKLTCTNPFKHRLKPNRVSGNPLTIAEWIPYETAPDYFEVTGAGLTSTIEIKAGGYVITLTGNFVEGDVVRVQPAAEDKVLLNGAAHPEMLALASDLENVALKTGDMVTVEPMGVVAVSIRGERA